MNTLSTNPNTYQPLDDQDVLALAPHEKAKFDQIAAGLSGTPAETPVSLPEDLNKGQLHAPIETPTQEEPTRGVLGRMKDRATGAAVKAGQFAFAHGVTTAWAVGDRLKSTNDDPEQSKWRTRARVGTIAVLGVGMAFGSSAVAAAKGIDMGGAHDVLQPGMGGGGHNATNNLHDVVHEAAPKKLAFEPHIPQDPADAQKAGVGALNPNPAPAIKDAKELVGDTWSMPEYNGPDDSLDSFVNKQVDAAFAANDLDPKTMTPQQRTELMNAFYNENGITDSTKMSIGDKKMGAFKAKLHQTLKEATELKADGAKAAQEAAKQFNDLKAEDIAKDLKAHKVEIDTTKLPEKIDLTSARAEHGDGVYALLDRQGLTHDQSAELYKVINSDHARETLVKWAPNVFMDSTDAYPDGDPRAHQLWLRETPEGKTMFTDLQAKEFDEKVRHLIDDFDSQAKKDADAQVAADAAKAKTGGSTQNGSTGTGTTGGNTPAPSTSPVAPTTTTTSSSNPATTSSSTSQGTTTTPSSSSSYKIPTPVTTPTAGA